MTQFMPCPRIGANGKLTYGAPADSPRARRSAGDIVTLRRPDGSVAYADGSARPVCTLLPLLSRAARLTRELAELRARVERAGLAPAPLRNVAPAGPDFAPWSPHWAPRDR